jgi:hypothetical protein
MQRVEDERLKEKESAEILGLTFRQVQATAK